PNPFNPTTTISFSVTQNSDFVTLEVYNIKGQKVKQLVNNQLSAGKHSVIWNGKDNNGKSVTSGIYFYKMKAGKFTSTKKMILLK
ncbi:MAG: FlgD immunoglobulin-like domain containing protein, partial [Candidatus Cloacimonadota bacterium]|nr:FlgD immunoglobulin-like domain containing protein [Candidatus Cloacimonadota bacterium]